MAQEDGQTPPRPVELKLSWTPEGLKVRVGGGPLVHLPYDTTLAVAMEAHGWLMSQLVSRLRKNPLTLG